MINQRETDNFLNIFKSTPPEVREAGFDKTEVKKVIDFCGLADLSQAYQIKTLSGFDRSKATGLAKVFPNLEKDPNILGEPITAWSWKVAFDVPEEFGYRMDYVPGTTAAALGIRIGDMVIDVEDKGMYRLGLAIFHLMTNNEEHDVLAFNRLGPEFVLDHYRVRRGDGLDFKHGRTNGAIVLSAANPIPFDGYILSQLAADPQLIQRKTSEYVINPLFQVLR